MSQNVEIVQQAFEAWNRGDYPAALKRIAPEIKVESHLGGDIDGTYEGIAGLQSWLAGFWGSFAEFHTDIDECIAGDAEVAILAHLYGRGRGSGVEVEMRNWQLFTVRDGLIVRYRLFAKREQALEAAGLQE
jgi:ketosteroid isomerase-like protein